MVFSRCADHERRRCDLYLHEIASPFVRKLRGANTRWSERLPTLSYARIAWVRERRGRPQVVMTRRLGSRGRSRRLRVAPRRPGTWLDGLELEGRWLGVDLRWSEPDEAPHREVRLVSLGGRNRLVDHSVGALSGHDFGGLSFWGDRFGWHRSCDEDECPGEAYRYHLDTGVKQFARIPRLAGFALNREGFVGVTRGGEVVRERRLAWRRDRG